MTGQQWKPLAGLAPSRHKRGAFRADDLGHNERLVLYLERAARDKHLRAGELSHLRGTGWADRAGQAELLFAQNLLQFRVHGATNQQIYSILPPERVQPEFTYFYCCSQYFQRRILEESSLTTLPITNKGRF